jgi:hypothetical protein
MLVVAAVLVVIVAAQVLTSPHLVCLAGPQVGDHCTVAPELRSAFLSPSP